MKGSVVNIMITSLEGSYEEKSFQMQEKNPELVRKILLHLKILKRMLSKN